MHDFFDTAFVVDAGKLNQNLVFAQPVGLDGRPDDAQRVNTVGDGFDGLLTAWSLSVLKDCGFMEITQVLSGPEAALYSGSRSSTMERRSEVASGRQALDHDPIRIGRIGLADVGVVDLAGSQGLFQSLLGDVGVDVHRVIDLHLQNEVGTAF